MGGSAATGNVNGGCNTGSVGGNGQGGAGVLNGRHLLDDCSAPSNVRQVLMASLLPSTLQLCYWDGNTITGTGIPALVLH